MKYEEYKHCLVYPETHKKMKIYQYENDLKSFDEVIRKLFEIKDKCDCTKQIK